MENINSIIQTLLAAHQVGATQEQRRAEVQKFDQLKNGEILSSAGIGAELTQSARPLEAQILGYAVLQHLVGNRWEEFSQQGQTEMANVAYSLMQQSTQSAAIPWVIRSKAALLIALVIKRSGPQFLEASLQELIRRATSGTLHQEIVCMTLKYLTDELVEFTDDMQGNETREMLAVFTNVLAPVARFLEQVIEININALGQQQQQQHQSEHVAAVHAALTAVESLSDSAPMFILQESGLIMACGYLLGQIKFREVAAAILKHIAGRKKANETKEEQFDIAVQQVGASLIQISTQLLAPDAIKELEYEGDNDAFGLLVCDALSVLGCSHFSTSFPDQTQRMTYFQNMSAFAQQNYLLLVDKSLVFWVKILQESAQTNSKQQQQHGTALPPEGVLLLMQLAGQQLQHHSSFRETEEYPPYFDSFEEYKEFISGYKQKLSHIIKASASLLPEQALRAAGELLLTAVAAAAGLPAGSAVASTGSTEALDQIRKQFEAAVFFTDSIIKAVWETMYANITSSDDAVQHKNTRSSPTLMATTAPSPSQQHGSVVALPAAASTKASEMLELPPQVQQLVAASESLLQSLLQLQTNDKIIVFHQARGIEAFARIVKVKPDVLPMVLTKLFDLMVDRIPLEHGGHLAPPERPTAVWRESLQARQNAANTFLEYARTAPEVFVLHIEGVAAKVTALWEAEKLRPGERNAIHEALIAASLAGDETLQANLAEWALSPIKSAWDSAEFRASVSGPTAFMACYLPVRLRSPVEMGCSGTAPVPFFDNGQGRWALYHQVHLAERSIRRMHQQSGGGGQRHKHQLAGAAPLQLHGGHLMAAHVSWILPVILQIMPCMNSVFSAAGRAAIGPHANAIYELSAVEKSQFLHRGPAIKRTLRAAAAAAAAAAAPSWQRDDSHIDGEYGTVGGYTTASVRAWIRHVSELCQSLVGMLPTHVPKALSDVPGIAPVLPQSLFAFVDDLPHQSVRMVMRHVILPMVKACPAQHIRGWTVPSVVALALHMQLRLTQAWKTLGPVREEHGSFTEDSAAANEEIISETMVREVTQEYADVLQQVSLRCVEDTSAVASAASSGLAATPSSSTFAGKSTAKGPTLLQLIMENNLAAGIAAASTAVEGMQLQDESAYRYATFCKALVSIAPLDKQLYDYVGTEVLRAAITSLASEVMSRHQADILGLIRSVLVQQLSDGSSRVHGVIQSLPGMSLDIEATFARSFLGTGSEKEQRNLVKKLLVGACGKGSFAALADWKPLAAANVVGGVVKQRGTRSTVLVPLDGVGNEEHLQGEITRALFAS